MLDAVLCALLVSKSVCKAHALPPEAAAPWQWAEWWSPVLQSGKHLGLDFSRGLANLASEAASRSGLNFRSLIGGHRPTSLAAAGLMACAISALDVRDNMLTAPDLQLLAADMVQSTTLSTLNLAGNPLTAYDLAALLRQIAECDGVSRDGASSPSFVELDASRTALCTTTDVEATHALAAAISEYGVLRSLALSQVGMDDATASILVAGLVAPSPKRGATILQLSQLDFSRNGLGRSFARALASAVGALPQLSVLNVSHNNLGTEAGAEVIACCLQHAPLRTLDVSSTNLCGCSPLYASEGVAGWSSRAMDALSAALAHSNLTTLVLHANELCGLWRERLYGQWVIRGTYTPRAIDTLIAVLEGGPCISLKMAGLAIDRDNFLRPAEQQRLLAALTANVTKGQRNGGAPATRPKGAGATTDSLLSVFGGRTKPAQNGSAPPPTADPSAGVKQPVGSEVSAGVPSGAGVVPTLAQAKEHQTHERSGGTSAAAMPCASAVRGSSDDQPPATSQASAEALEGSSGRSMRASTIHSNAASVMDSGVGAAAALSDNPDSSPMSQAEGRGHEDDNHPRVGANAGDTMAAIESSAMRQVVEVMPTRFVKTDDSVGNSKNGAKPHGKSLSRALTMPQLIAGEKARKEEGAARQQHKGATSEPPKVGAPMSPPKVGAPVPAAPKPATRTSAGYGQAKKPKKKVEKKVVEEKVSAFAQAPLMVAVAPLHARTEADHDAPLVGANHRIAVGSLMRVGETRVVSFKEKLSSRMATEQKALVELDGDTEALGWVTSITKDENENIKLATMGLPLMRATRLLPVRDSTESDANRVGEVREGEGVRVLETFTSPDGTSTKVRGCRAPPCDAIASGPFVGRPLGRGGESLARAHTRLHDTPRNGTHTRANVNISTPALVCGAGASCTCTRSCE